MSTFDTELAIVGLATNLKRFVIVHIIVELHLACFSGFSRRSKQIDLVLDEYNLLVLLGRGVGVSFTRCRRSDWPPCALFWCYLTLISNVLVG